jgi:hypothetical protein
MHGFTEAHFFEMVASFLGPYYLLLALMNGVAALSIWQTGQTKVWIKIP